MSPHDTKHIESVKKIAATVQDFYRKRQKVRVYHGETNSTRKSAPANLIDISGLNRIISIHTEGNYALVEPNVSMEQLVNETLKYSLVPPVAMEFPAITVGGGVQGGAGESSSFKWGLFHDICEEYEIILGNGNVVRASATENKDLYEGTACSYGTLGIITLIKLRLIPCKPYVQLTYERTNSFQETVEMVAKSTGLADFTDAILFNKTFGVVLSGSFSDKIGLPVHSFSKITDNWFYLHAQSGGKKGYYEDLIPLKDYLFRYDRGAFWGGKYVFKYFNIPSWRLFRTIFNPLLPTKRLYKALHATGISQRYIVQDITVPYSNAVPFLDYLDQTLHIYPLWICPLRTDEKAFLSPSYIKTDLPINVGIWGETDPDSFHEVNRSLENFTKEVGGRKVLYAHTYYPQDEFWEIYDESRYTVLRQKYMAEKIFPTIYEKVYVSEKYVPDVTGGLWRLIKKKLPFSRHALFKHEN